MMMTMKDKDAIFASRTIKKAVDIGGYSLYVNCYGKGTPTVIFESGMGDDNKIWNEVQSEVSNHTRTFSYDRAGLGSLSDVSKLPRTSLNQVRELHSLLENAKVKPPYIIVAHSIGGYNARIFAGLYPKEVAGIVFVDCSHENQGDYFTNLSSEAREEIKNYLVDKEQDLDNQILSANQVKEIRKRDSLRNVPIIILTANHNQKIVDSQIDIALLSNNSKHIIVKESGHYIQSEQPQVVINAINEIINIVKNNTKMDSVE